MTDAPSGFPHAPVRSYDWAYATGLTLAVAFAVYAFAVVHFGVRDGGQGDESHRLLIAYRVNRDLWSAWHLYITQPWPPLPYIMQVAAHRALKLIVGISDREFIQSAISTSIVVFTLHLTIVMEICRRLGATLAGLFYVAALFGTPLVVDLATSAMAEGPALLFLSLAGLYLTSVKERMAVISVGTMLLLASLCRSEVAMFGAILAVGVAFRHDAMAGAVLFVISTAGFGFKTIYNIANSTAGMSYLNLRDFYSIGDSVGDRLISLSRTLPYEVGRSEFSGYVFILLAIVLAAGTLARTIEPRPKQTQPLTFGLGVFLFGALATLAIVAMMAAGKILPSPRYFVISLSIFILGASLMACSLQARVRGGSRPSHRFSRAITGTLAPVLFLVTCTSMFRALWSLDTKLPIELRQLRDVILRSAGPTSPVVIDALVFWDPYPLVQAIIGAGAERSGCVYDMPALKQTQGMTAAVVAGESRKTTRLLAYVDQYEPTLLVTAGREWRAHLDSINTFSDYDERSSYILPSISWRNAEEGELSLRRIGSNKRFRVTLTFENAKVKVYGLARVGS